MAYSPTVYVNDSTPALSAENLNKSENELKYLDDQLTDVTNASNMSVGLSSYTWELGSIDANGLPVSSNTRIRSSFIEVTEGTVAKISNGSNIYAWCYDGNRQVVTNSGSWVSSYTIPSGSGIKYFRFVARENGTNPTIPSSSISTIVARCSLFLKLRTDTILFKFNNDSVQNIKDKSDETYSEVLKKKNETFGWESGGIDHTQGYTYNTTKRIRTDAFIYVKKGMYIKLINNNYLFNVTRYSSTSYTSIIGSTDFRTATYKIPSDCYIKIDICRTDGNDMTTTAGGNIVNSYYNSYPLKEQLDDLESIAIVKSPYNYSWENGGVSEESGTNYNTTKRIRTVSYYKIASGLIIRILNSAYKFKVSLYTVPDYRGYYSTSSFVLTGEYAVTDKCYIKIDIARIDGADIDISSATDVLEIFNYENKIVVEKDSLGDNLKSRLYLQTSWQTPIQEIQNAQEFCFTFGIQTDTHYSGALYNFDENSFRQFAEVSNYIGMDFMCNLGDIIRGYNDVTTADEKIDLTTICNRYFENNTTPFLFSMGNHDDNNGLYPKDFYAHLMKKAENTNRLVRPSNDVLYGYMDFPEIRVVMLNTRDADYSSYPVNVNTHIVRQEQIDWFTNVATNTDKYLVILSHVPPLDSLITDGHYLTNADVLLEALTGKKVVGWFCGHTHNQSNNTSENGIEVITFANGSNFAEIVMVNLEEKSITTKMIGDYGTLVNRLFENAFE